MPAIYPPFISSLTKIGYISDINKIPYSRDIGRSFTLNSHHYILFGDTFCKNSAGEFVGLTNNTAALLHNSVPRFDPNADEGEEGCVPNSEVLVSKYQEIEKDGVVKPFIPFKAGEVPDVESGKRVVLWCFGGCVELEDHTGRVWFEKSIIPAEGNGEGQYCGMGIAKVTIHHGKLHLERLRGTLEFDLLFGPEEPRVGSFSTLVHGSFVYLWSLFEGNIVLARTHRSVTVLAGAYMFWNGKQYVEDFREAVPVLGINDAGIVQGGIVRSNLFGEKWPFLLIGVNKYTDSKIQLGVAERIEGPWEIQTVGVATGIDKKDGFMYCIYPAIWASDTRKGELVVTWSEQYPGGVIAAKIQFEMDGQKDEL